MKIRSSAFRRFLGLSIFSLLVSGLLAVPTFALNLEEAKANGLVGEQATGYLGIVSGANAQVQALVSEINQKRKQKYQEIAKKRNTQLVAVEKLAGKEAIERTPRGQYVSPSAGKWVKK